MIQAHSVKNFSQHLKELFLIDRIERLLDVGLDKV